MIKKIMVVLSIAIMFLLGVLGGRYLFMLSDIETTETTETVETNTSYNKSEK